MQRILTSALAALAFICLTSCDNDPDNLYGKKKEMQILDEHGDVTTHTYASLISGTSLEIVGGIGNNHIVEVENESILTFHYNHRGAGHSTIPTETLPANVIIQPHKLGSTTVSITDSDIDKTIHVQVDIVNEYSALTISGSNVEGMEDGMMIALQRGESSEYRIVSQNGKEWSSSETGEYHFRKNEEDYQDRGYLLLTLKSGDSETTWKITDADNNKDDYQYYISDIMYGLNLPDDVMTKFSPAFRYPSVFLFTDTSDPDRSFITGPADITIKYTF